MKFQRSTQQHYPRIQQSCMCSYQNKIKFKEKQKRKDLTTNPLEDVKAGNSKAIYHSDAYTKKGFSSNVT